MQSIIEKEKILNLGPKILYFGTFRSKFERTLDIFEISTLKSFKKENLVEKQKSLDLGPKLLDLGIFGIEFEKTIVILKSISKLSEMIF